jgi:hypothetical protein
VKNGVRIYKSRLIMARLQYIIYPKKNIKNKINMDQY